MMCRPARHACSTIHALARSSKALKIQSSSPFGPATNPSTLICICRTSGLMMPPLTPERRLGGQEIDRLTPSPPLSIVPARSGRMRVRAKD